MKQLFKLGISCLFLSLLSLNAYAAAPGRWSNFETLNDNAKNGIDFSWKRDCKRIDDKACVITLKWRNRYSTSVKTTYRIEFTGENGNQYVQEDIILQPGESPEFTIVGETLSQAQVGVEKQTIKGATLTPFEDAEEEHAAALKRANKAEQDRRLQEAENIALHQIRQQNEQQRRAALANEQRNQSEKEERRREKEEQIRWEAKQAQQNAESNNNLMAGLQSFQNSINQGAATMNYANQVSADVDAQLRRQKEERAREAREEQRRQAEYAAQQRRDAEESRRLQHQRAQESERAAQERQERAEQERVAREAERKAAAAKLAKEQAERDKQKKEQIALNNSAQYTESSSGSYAMTAEQRQIQLKQLAQAQQKQQQAQAPQQQQPPQQTQPLETCPPQIWDEYNKDKTQFTVYVLNTCQRSRLEVTSINYYDMEHVLCNTMLMPDRFQPGSKVIPLDCRKFASDGETWRFPGYKVIYKIIY